MRILVVDDHAVIGETPGRKVLLDLRLPEIDGIDVLRRVRADLRTKSLPVMS